MVIFIHGDAYRSQIGIQRPVIGSEGKAVRTMIIGIRGIDHIDTTQIQAAMIRSIHDRKCQWISLDIAGGQGDIQRDIFIGHYRLVAGLRGVVNRGNVYGYGRRIGSAVSVKNSIDEAVGTVIVSVRLIGNRSIGIDGDGAVSRVADLSHTEGITVGVAIVGQNIDGNRGILIGSCEIVIGDRGIIDRVHRHGHLTHGQLAVPAADTVFRGGVPQ